MRFPLQIGGPMEESSNKMITLCELSQNIYKGSFNHNFVFTSLLSHLYLEA